MQSSRSDEGRRSFPSGHASSSFAGLGFAALFMAGQLKLFDGHAHLERLLLCLLPLIVAWLIALSRIINNRHHWDDVLVGSLIGIACAIFSYIFYFPSLWSVQCDEPRDARFLELKEEAVRDANSAAVSNTCEPDVISKENVV